MLDIFISKINRMFQSDIFEGKREVPFPFSCEEKEKENWFLHIDLDIVPSYRGNRNQLPFYFPSPSSPPLKKTYKHFPHFPLPLALSSFPFPPSTFLWPIIYADLWNALIHLRLWLSWWPRARNGTCLIFHTRVGVLFPPRFPSCVSETVLCRPSVLRALGVLVSNADEYGVEIRSREFHYAHSGGGACSSRRFVWLLYHSARGVWKAMVLMAFVIFLVLLW